MEQISAHHIAKTRRSCERCRQQKKRCSAEKPSCSLCCRLNEACVYLPRGQQTGHSARKCASPRAQAARRESVDQQGAGQHVIPQSVDGEVSQELYHPSSSIYQNTDTSPTVSSVEQPDPSRFYQSNSTWLVQQHSINPRFSSTESLCMRSMTKTEPPEDSLDFFVDAYRNHLYFRPLPLFDPSRLKADLKSFPQFLRWGFLALVLKFTSHAFYGGKKKQATEFYKASCQSEVMELSSQGTARLEVLRSLCILALLDVLDGNFAQAWMTIGTAARLQALRLLYPEEDVTTEIKNSDGARCYWSIFILEKAFSPNFCLLAQHPHVPKYPSSPPPPLMSRLDPNDEDTQRLGINACCLQAVSIWGDVVSYLEGIRLGRAEQPWLPSSEHSQLTMKLHELELNLAHQHLLRKVSFRDRGSAELQKEQEYWAPWILMQFVSHAAHAALHNPFIQLVALRKSKSLSQPLSFLQRSVDQSLFHSAWVARLLRACDSIPFPVHDPIVGQMVAATATIPWLFQFARDRNISSKAKEDIREYDEALGHFSERWPHIARKKMKRDILRYLQSFTQRGLYENVGDGTTVKFPPQLVWELFTPRPLDAMFGGRGGISSTFLPSMSGDETLQIITNYAHPPHEGTEEPQHSRTTSEKDDWLDDPMMHEFLSDFALADFSWLPFYSPEELRDC
ncbi:hypothetical protein FSST1_006476 [Fusarium sambucinum]